MTVTVHEASVDTGTGRVIFKLQVGEARLAGQVPSVDEYRALLVLYCGWRAQPLPAPVPVTGLPEVSS